MVWLGVLYYEKEITKAQFVQAVLISLKQFIGLFTPSNSLPCHCEPPFFVIASEAWQSRENQKAKIKMQNDRAKMKKVSR